MAAPEPFRMGQVGPETGKMCLWDRPCPLCGQNQSVPPYRGAVGRPEMLEKICLRIRKAHAFLAEDALVHELEVIADFGHELHLVKNLRLEINAGSNLNERYARGPQLEHGALGDVQNGLVDPVGVVTGEGDLLHLPDELFSCAFLLNDQPPIPAPGFKPHVNVPQ